MSEAMNLRTRAVRYLGDAMRGVQQAPVEVIATLCVAITFSWGVEAGGEAMRAWMETAIACVLLLVVAWTGTLLHALGAWGAMRRWAVTLAGAFAIAGYAFTSLDLERDADGWRALLLLGAALAWVIALPALAGAATSAVDRMRRIDGRVLLRVIGAVLYGAALFAGLALALRAIDVLFELDLDEDIYAHVWGWISFVLIPWIVLGGLRDYVRPIEQENAVAGIAQRIVLFLVSPLLALYYLILYAYVVRIVVTEEIPKNLVSPLVLAAGGLAALGLLLFDPRPAARGVVRWLRTAPPLFLPLVPLGAWALLLRTNQYGLTEFRLVRLVVLGVLAALAIGATVQLVRKRAFALHLAPLTLAVVLLLSAIGPWSVLAFSRRSQQHRLAAALAQLDVPAADSTWRRTPPDTARRIVPAAAYEEVRSTAQYLVAHHGRAALPPVLRQFAAGEEGRWRDYAADLGLQPDAPTGLPQQLAGGTLAAGVPVELEGGTAWRIDWFRPPAGAHDRAAPVAPATPVRIALRDSLGLELRVAGSTLYADLTRLAAALPTWGLRPMAQDGLPADEAVLVVTDTTGAARGQLVVWHLMVEADSTGPTLNRVEGLLVVRGGAGGSVDTTRAAGGND